MRTSTRWLGLLALAGSPAVAQERAQLVTALERRIAQSAGGGAVVGLYVHDLRTTDSILINADLRFHAASTMKVPVMIQVFREVDAGRLRLQDALAVTDTFRSIADTSHYRLDRADDSDSSLYARVGRTASVRELVELMITVSSNLATNILIDRVRSDSVQAAMRAIGADSMLVLRGVEDGAAFRAGLNNTTTARALGQIFVALAEGRAASPASCGQMLAVLARQRFRDAIPAGLPRNTRVAHKTGTITALHHDGGVIYVGGRPRYVLVVLTRGLEDRRASAALIADLTRMIHESLEGPVIR